MGFRPSPTAFLSPSHDIHRSCRYQPVVHSLFSSCVQHPAGFVLLAGTAQACCRLQKYFSLDCMASRPETKVMSFHFWQSKRILVQFVAPLLGRETFFRWASRLCVMLLDDGCIHRPACSALV